MTSLSDGIGAGIVAQRRKARDAVPPQRPRPARRAQHLRQHGQSPDETGAAETDHDFARRAGAHRHVERQHDSAAVGRRRAAQHVEADGVIVLGEAIELEPENVGRDFGDFFDGGAARHAKRVRNARALGGPRQMVSAPGHTIAGPPIGAMPIGAA